MPQDDQATYNMLCEGRTLGVFQVESPLLATWSKKVQPKKHKDVSLLLALVRPGVLNARAADGKSMAQKVVDRKNGIEEVEYTHEILRRALSNTYGILVYQESLMFICEDIAGWSKIQGLELQKAIAKKKAELVSSLKPKFIEDAVKHGSVTREEATDIYESMEASARYLFNQGHSDGYAMLTYTTAYLKCHYPLEYICSSLELAGSAIDPKEEIAKFVGECRALNINIYGPSILKSSDHFDIIGEDIYFGLADVSGVGESNVATARAAIQSVENQLGKNIDKFIWMDWLVCLGHKITGTPKISGSIFEKWIRAGVFDHIGLSRRQMIHELKNWQLCSPGEHKWARNNYNNYNTLYDLLIAMARTKKEGGAVTKEDRIYYITSIAQSIKYPPTLTRDTIDYLVQNEKELLGIAISCSKLDNFDISLANTTVRDLVENNYLATPAIMVAELKGFRIVQTKSGKNPGRDMAFLHVIDKEMEYSDLVIFPNEFEKYQEFFWEGNILLLQLEATSKGSPCVKVVASLYQD